VRIRFLCPKCQTEQEITDVTHDETKCSSCQHLIQLSIRDRMRKENQVDHCVICDCHKVYVQKDFNRTIGMTIFCVGVAISLVLFGMNLVWQSMAVLLGCALLDTLLYRLLPDVTICYKCHTQFRDYSPNPDNMPFELGLAEKFDPLDKSAGAENPAAEWKTH